MSNIVEMSPSQLKIFFIMGEAVLNLHKEDVNSLNVFPVPDGDTGTNMGLTIKSAIKSLDRTETVKEICAAISMGALMGARGNSGVILSQLFRGIATGLQDKKTIDSMAMAKALQRGVDIAYKSVLKPVEGTILTVSRAVAAAALEKAKTETDIVVVLEHALLKGEAALENTPNLLPVLKEAGVVDAGGKGFLYILQGGLMGLKGEKTEDLPPLEKAEQKTIKITDQIIDDLPEKEEDILFQYCTEFFIKNTKAPLEKVKARLLREGDSLVVVGDVGVIKVHIHTNDPGRVLSYAVSLGELFDMKIENMKEQVARRKEAKKPEEKPMPKKRCGVVAVAAGKGMAEIFKSMGVDEVISGGQTMNPSAEDILNSIHAVPAEEVVILPNNSNIILAARQTEKMSAKPVAIVPSKFVTQGILGVLNFNPDVSAAENAKEMESEIGHAINCEITYAVRDTAFNGFNIKANDILALCDGDISEVGKNVDETTLALLAKVMPEGAELLTLYFGEDIEEDDAQALTAKIGEAYPNLEVEVYNGGQPLYYYYISIE